MLTGIRIAVSLIKQDNISFFFFSHRLLGR
jgi:hypothetical protein